MPKKPSFQFYPGDWMKDPKLSMCQPASRGVWIDLMCAMHENEQSGEIAGTVVQLARICRCLPNEMDSALKDLSVTKNADVTGSNGIVTVRNRRMYEDAKERKQGRDRVQKHRAKKNGNEIVTPPSSSSTSTSVEKEETIVSSKMKKGTRIPKDFYPSEEMISWAKEFASTIDLEVRITEFKNYWEAKTGKDATKLDWNKTFQNRIIAIMEYLTNKNQGLEKNGSSNKNGKSAKPKQPNSEVVRGRNYEKFNGIDPIETFG